MRQNKQEKGLDKGEVSVEVEGSGKGGREEGANMSRREGQEDP